MCHLVVVLDSKVNPLSTISDYLQRSKVNSTILYNLEESLRLGIYITSGPLAPNPPIVLYTARLAQQTTKKLMICLYLQSAVQKLRKGFKMITTQRVQKIAYKGHSNSFHSLQHIKSIEVRNSIYLRPIRQFFCKGPVKHNFSFEEVPDFSDALEQIPH